MLDGLRRSPTSLIARVGCAAAGLGDFMFRRRPAALPVRFAAALCAAAAILGPTLGIAILPSPLHAAEFRVLREAFSASRPEPVIALSGAIGKGDAAKLAAVVADLCRKRECDYQNTAAMLTLDSPGGSFGEGIAIANLMREKSVAAIVEDGAVCLSACALAWLGGSSFHATGGVGTYVDRYVEPGGRIGFHSPYISPAAMAALPEDQRLDTQASGLRLGISTLVRFLADFAVSPLVIDRIVAMGPDDVMAIETVADVVAFGGELPPVPVSTLGLDRRAITRAVCEKLLALHYRADLTEVTALQADYRESPAGRTKEGEVFLGFDIDDRPLTLAFCGAGAGQAIPSGDFSVQLARMAWLEDVSDTYTEPFTSFVFSSSGWNQAAYDGQRASQSVLRLTPMISWLLPRDMRIADLAPAARAAIAADKRGVPLPADPPPAASPPASSGSLAAAIPDATSSAAPAAPAAPPEAGFARFSAAVISDVRPLVDTGDLRVWRFGDLDVEVDVGPATLFAEERLRRDGLEKRNLTYDKSFAGAFVYSGVAPDRRSGFYTFALDDGDEAATVRMRFALGADGRASVEAQSLIGKIACSARFGSAGLPCAKK
ncbi:hypothetical protein [Aurantimonas sp. 22II-16-19i]|uniref:hypothetical protein n=1 Tax=Aurantimonas sp. 22II-16-19i TaxID=1317114 RepID=UPI0009F7D857|nr:hypothetical protein [Aurantimonas sp. 22II-16-19i]ORE92804.1 lipoprotein [Aurantimonas sp. 22II-16-19i]